MKFFKISHNFLRIKIGQYFFYFSRHAMQPIQFEKRQRQKKRRKLRGQVLDRANHHCEMCGCELDWKSISVHHIQPRLTHPELEFEPSNLCALCHDCHRKLHEKERLSKLGILPII